MKKIFIPLFLLLASFFILSCDQGTTGVTYPEVTEPQAKAAFDSLYPVLQTTMMSAINGATSGTGWTSTISMNGSVVSYIITYTNIAITENAEYSSVSGSMNISINTDTSIMTMSIISNLTGSGPVITGSISVTTNSSGVLTANTITINGHDMTSELSNNIF